MIKLLKAYGTFASGSYVILPDDTESALIAQNLAIASTVTTVGQTIGGPIQLVTVGGNVAMVSNAGIVTPTYYQGPLNFPCISLGSAALTTYETNGVAPVAGSWNLTEIFVPFWQTWTGIGKLNGTTVATDKNIVALFGTDGKLLANSDPAGTTTATASVFQNQAFLTPITLPPGRYFLGVQSNGTTDTLRHILAANGSNVCTSETAGTFGTIPASLTPPATFTTAKGVITQLYV